MCLEFSVLTTTLLNCLGIPAVHLAIAWLGKRIPDHHFVRPLPSTPPRPGKFYEKYFLIRRWKHLLPDGTPCCNPFPKKKLQSTDADYLRKFILETRRGEFSHWLQWILITAFIVWNPLPAQVIIIVYAFATNVPCLLNLRHTRQRLLPVLIKKI